MPEAGPLPLVELPLSRHSDRVTRARRWWPVWLAAHVVTLGVGLVGQLRLVTEECRGCPAVFRLSDSQQRALGDVGGTVEQFRVLVALIILAFALGAYWLAWVLVRRSRGERFPVVIGYILVAVGTGRWIEDAAMLGVGGPLGVVLRVAGVGNYAGLIALFALFPDGYWRPRWSRWVVALVTLWALALYTTPMLESLAKGGEPVASIDAIVFLTGMVLAVVWQATRYRSGDGATRAAVRWIATALGCVVVVLVPLVLSLRTAADTDPRLQAVSVGLVILGFFLLLLAVAAAVVRHRLWDVDVIVNRTVVYGGLTVTILVIYVALVTLASGPARSYGAAAAAAPQCFWPCSCSRFASASRPSPTGCSSASALDRTCSCKLWPRRGNMTPPTSSRRRR